MFSKSLLSVWLFVFACMHVCLGVCVYAWVYFRLVTCIYLYVFVFLSSFVIHIFFFSFFVTLNIFVHPSVCVNEYVCLFWGTISLFSFLPVFLSIIWSVSLSLYIPVSLFLAGFLFVCPSVGLYVHLSVCLSGYIYIRLSLHVWALLWKKKKTSASASVSSVLFFI